MSFEIKTIEVFDRQAKRLAKHYASFKQDYKDFLDELRKNPLVGTDLGGGVRKVRMAIVSKGKGKSGGARVIIQQMLLFALNKGRLFSCQFMISQSRAQLLITKSNA